MIRKPVIFYIDDEPMQHIALEQLIPEDWELICFDNPIDAIAKLSESKPTIIISDQRMPQMLGFKFLETARQICPDAIRIITTGYNDENSIVESIRSAKVFDYIVKPWDIERLMQSLERARDFYFSEVDRKSLASDLQDKNKNLNIALKDMEILLRKYEDARGELKSWVHPFILSATEEKLQFPVYKDLSLLVIDIIDSSKLHQMSVNGIDIRVLILQSAWEIVLKHGGEIESQEGDKVYANFGMSGKHFNLANAAFAAAKEFRSSLQAINDHYGVTVEAGVAIHYAEKCKINLRQSAINTEAGIVVRKKFDTSSSDVDLCHRIESISHKLPGSNIVISEALRARLDLKQQSFIELGSYVFKGQTVPALVHLVKSDKASQDDVQRFKKYLEDNFTFKQAA